MATAAPSPPTSGGTPAPESSLANAPSLFESFVNVPHPAASKSCQAMSVIAAPGAEVDERLLAQIQSFCFPEYEEGRTHQPIRSTADFKGMWLNRYDQYAMQPKSFSSFTFTLQLQDGRRLYGHVRRTLPMHGKSPKRYDVGRRGERALVLLTSTAGAGQLYQAILKSVDAITSLNLALDSSLKKVKEPEKLFLHALHREQQRMAAHYQKSATEQRGKPLIAALSGLEVQESPLYAPHDINRYMVPTCLLQSTAGGDATNNLPTADTTSSVLPLLRCVGVAHALRIFAALLSERRVILASSSPTRLSTCSHAALAMLQSGLLHWQHLYIPVLPPHLWQYLAAPYPYLIGILDSAVPKLDKTDGLGEVLLVNLDSNAMETRNIPQQVVAQRLPDLFSAADPGYYNENGGPSPRNDRDLPPSASEFLAQDLLDILKTDKKTLYGENSAVVNLGETAGKAAKAIKSGFGKLKARLKGQSSSVEDDEKEKQEETPAEDKSVADDYIFTEGCHNEVGEQEARLAFACFFLSLLGNMRWYLNSPGQGQIPVLDRQRFLEQKRLAGDGQGSALWPLLQNFCQTQMFEEFAKARVEEVRSRVVAPADSPLFAQCAQYHRHHNIDFGVMSVRNVARQVAQANPGRLTGLLQTNARRMAMSLTSNKNFEGDYGRAIAQLVDQCRESSSVLFDVMSVIWLRIRDCRGLQWKHGYQALQLLKHLLYHGPLAAVVEATDGLDKIRALRSYEHMRSGVAQDIRNSATAVYTMLVDRAKLWAMRRVFAEKRRQMIVPVANKKKLLKMDRNVRPTHPIEHIHGIFHPLARPTIAPVPQQRVAAPATPQQAQFQQPGAQPQRAASQPDDPFGLGTGAAPAAPAQPTSSVNQDLMGLFGDMAVSPAPAPTAQQAQFDAQPTIVSIPPKTTPPVVPPAATAPPPTQNPAQPQPSSTQQYYNGAAAPPQNWAQPQQQQWQAQQQQQQQQPPFPGQPQYQQQQAAPQQYQQLSQPFYGHQGTTAQPQQGYYQQQAPPPQQKQQQPLGHAQQQHQQAQANLHAAQQQQRPPQPPAPAPTPPVNPKQFDPFAGL